MNLFQGIMRFSSQSLIFSDAINYCTNMSLSKFAKVYLNGEDISKGVFPHSYYHSIECIKDAKEFPPYSKFASSLSKPLEKDKLAYLSEFNSLSENQKSMIDVKDNFFMSPNQYLSSLNEFNHKIESGEWQNMSCYLSYYNNRDTVVLALGYENFVKACISTYDLSPLNCISLAEMASKLSWKYYCPMSYSIFSFNDKFAHLNVNIRRYGLSGGYCGIGIRHVVTNCLPKDEPDLIPEVTTSPCGLPYATCAGWDANSLYAHGMQQNMLCGPGTLLKINNEGDFQGEFMGSKSNGLTQFSFVRDLNSTRFKL